MSRFGTRGNRIESRVYRTFCSYNFTLLTFSSTDAFFVRNSAVAVKKSDRPTTFTT